MYDVKYQFLQSVMFQMGDELSEEQLDKLKVCLLSNLREVTLERNIFDLSCELDDNWKYLKLFVASRRLEGMSERTIRSYVFYTKAFLAAVNKNFREITTIDIQWYLSEYELSHHVSKRSLDNIRRGLNGWFIWLEEQENIPSNPVRRIRKIAYEKPPITVLSDEEIVNIRDYLYGNVRSRAMFEVLLATGVRVSEFCAIDISDVDFVENKITIHTAKKRYKEDRTVFLTAEARKYLIDYLDLRKEKGWDNSPALFQSNRKGGDRFTERLVNGELRRIEKACNLKKKMTCHVFRRTVASTLHRRGMSGCSIAKYLGHTTSATSETYYINVDVTDLQYSYRKLM